MDIDRIPPHNLEAEMACLGAAMVDPEMFDIIAERVRPSDFYAALHETIFATLVALTARRAPLDMISVAEELRLRGMLDKIGGIAYLHQCLNVLPSAASSEYYARLVREKSDLRGLIHAGTQITAAGYEGEYDVRAAQARAEQLLSAATDDGGREVRIERIGAVAERIIQRIEDGVAEPVFRAPWSSLNARLGGFMAGELVAWVAAPKCGKSGCVLGVADYSAARYGATVLFANELGVEATTRRHLAMYSAVPARRQRTDALRPDEFEASRLLEARRKVGSMPLYAFGREVRSLAQMWRILRQIASREPIASIIVDHVGLLEDVSQESGRTTEHQRLDRAYQDLIKMAYQFRCPCHTVQHLNREGYKSGANGKAVEPNFGTIAHVRGGGNVEGHASAIIFPYRPMPLGTAAEREVGKFIIALSRDGEGGYVDMRFIGSRHLWLEYDGEHTAVPWFEQGRKRDVEDVVDEEPVMFFS
jgi:replicative DNA helicase